MESAEHQHGDSVHRILAHNFAVGPVTICLLLLMGKLRLGVLSDFLRCHSLDLLCSLLSCPHPFPQEWLWRPQGFHMSPPLR